MIIKNEKEVKSLWETVGFGNKEEGIATAELVAIFLTEEDVLSGDFYAAGFVGQMAQKDKNLTKLNHITNGFSLTENGVQRLVIIGLGQTAKLEVNALRKAAGCAARAIKECKADTNAVLVPLVKNEEQAEYVRALAEGLLLGSYEFNECKSDPEQHKIGNIEIFIDTLKIDTILEEAGTIAESVLWTRNLVNRPGNMVQPLIMALEAEHIAEEFGLSCEVLGKEQMIEKGMGSLLAVAQGSAAEPRMITLKYTGAGKEKPYVAFVGKGITFDSGGISIKPSEGMGEMKDDMAGAGAVLGAMKAIAELKLPCNVIGIAACAENMPSGTATRPGDVVKAANGKTIEVVNTDAEGRMVLADAVWYACRQGAAKVIDIATLTGAVIIALGTETAGIVSNDDALCAAIIKAGKKCGENYWQLPALPECKEALKSDVADLLNSTGRPGGTITGGLFIGEFVDEKMPWAHIDIGGTSTAAATKGFWVKGATGMGVATLVEIAKEL